MSILPSFTFYVCIIGTTDVGKTCILNRRVDGDFSFIYKPTIGTDYKQLKIESAESIVNLRMWDTAGQERFASITRAYYRPAHGILLVYDVSDRSTFDDIEKRWMKEIEFCERSELRVILVGNKSDLVGSRFVSYEEGVALGQKLGLTFMEVSAKNNTNINELFDALVTEMKAAKPTPMNNQNVVLDNQDGGSRTKCSGC